MTCCIFLEKLKTTPIIMVLTNNTTDWEAKSFSMSLLVYTTDIKNGVYSATSCTLMLIVILPGLQTYDIP